MKYNSKSGIESRMKNGFSAMDVILSVAIIIKLMTSSDTSEFVKSESEYYLSGRLFTKNLTHDIHRSKFVTQKLVFTKKCKLAKS